MSPNAPTPIKPERPIGGTAPETLSCWQSENLRTRRSLLSIVLLLAICFAKPLFDLMQLAFHSQFYSYILLIPFVSIYLIRGAKMRTSAGFPAPRKWAFVFLSIGAVALGLFWMQRSELPLNDALALTTIAFVCLVLGACLFFLGGTTLRALAFPLLFLFFMVPFPGFLELGVETFFQHTSATAADWMLNLSGMPVFKEGLFFQLPGFRMAVAPECSGIRSSLVLLITSLLAGHLFLKTPWKKAVLVLAIIPLAIVRNGFRIFVIAQLCVRVGPEMIDSPIHHQGGVIFFVLSLVPFFILLFVLFKSELVSKPKKVSK